MLAVYGGYPGRYAAGCGAERDGDFRYVVFSDASPAFVAALLRRYGPLKRAQLVLEPRARTTAQNARYVARLARERQCRSLVVVTSWWHVPRALLLTRMALWGSGVFVTMLPVEDTPRRRWGDAGVWLEIPRLWGSLWTFASDTRASYALPRVARPMEAR
jgi:uncharacterized SAM-binding protein YcdF (DUF218 family)